jgi:hypothetical protein
VQHDQLLKVRVAHRAKELVLLPDRIGHGAGSLAGSWGAWGFGAGSQKREPGRPAVRMFIVGWKDRKIDGASIPTRLP